MHHICQYINMNIKVNRSHGLGYRCKELGMVYQTQSSTRKSRNLVKSMGSKKKKKKITIYRQGCFFTFSTFPISLDLQPYTSYYLENSHVCVFTLTTDFNKHLFWVKHCLIVTVGEMVYKEQTLSLRTPRFKHKDSCVNNTKQTWRMWITSIEEVQNILGI